jgi:hypothetical protein
MTGAAKDAAKEAERAFFVGCEFNRDGLSRLKRLIDAESRERETMRYINTGDVEAYLVSFIDGNG